VLHTDLAIGKRNPRDDVRGKGEKYNNGHGAFSFICRSATSVNELVRLLQTGVMPSRHDLSGLR
jgi:hypothetical protein